MLQRIWLAITFALFTVSAANAQTNTKGIEFNNQSSSPCGVSMSCMYTTSSGGNFLTTAADGASAVALAINTSTGWTNATARLIKASTNSVEHFAVYASGLIESSWARNIGTAQTPGLILANTTAAVGGTVQRSPAIQLTGNQENSGSKTVDWQIQAVPIDGNADSGSLVIFSRYNGGSWERYITVKTGPAASSPTIGGAVAGTQIEFGNNLLLNGSSGGVMPAVNGTIVLGNFSTYWASIAGAFYNMPIGNQITAAASITPTTGFHHVTGATTIDNIVVTNVPTGGATRLTLWADGSTITVSAAGNVLVGASIAQDTSQDFIYDAVAAKWSPVQ